jgi:pimeloyl-ACP methyl ester carboxylesterase
MRRKLTRRFVVSLLLVVSVITTAAYLGASYLMAEGATHPTRLAIDRAPLVRGSYEDIAFITGDGLKLRGWFFPGTSDRAVIVIHGRNANRMEWQDPDHPSEARRSERIADFLLADGYSVMLFDLRGHGESEGMRYSFGYYERRDVVAAIGFLVERGFRRERLGLVGISLGALSSIALLTLDPQVGPLVLDSSPADVGVAIAESLESDRGIPSFFAPGMVLAARVAFGVDLDAIRPIDIVRAHPERAFLFIHCDADELVPVHHARDLRAASANPTSELWIAPGCLHPRASDDHPEEYRSRVLAFLRAQMP